MRESYFYGSGSGNIHGVSARGFSLDEITGQTNNQTLNEPITTEIAAIEAFMDFELSLDKDRLIVSTEDKSWWLAPNTTTIYKVVDTNLAWTLKTGRLVVNVHEGRYNKGYILFERKITTSNISNCKTITKIDALKLGKKEHKQNSNWGTYRDGFNHTEHLKHISNKHKF